MKLALCFFAITAAFPLAGVAEEIGSKPVSAGMFSREAATRMARKACLDMTPVAALGLDSALKGLPDEKVRETIAKRTERDRDAGKFYASVLDNDRFVRNIATVVTEHARMLRTMFPNDQSKYAESVKATHGTYMPVCEKDMRAVFLSYLRTK